MDQREMAWDPFKGSFNEQTMIGLLYGDEQPVHCHFVVCPTCRGRGSHVNPSIDSHGISSQEFYDDPEFAEDYFAGTYDVSCAECRGRRVVPRPDDNEPNKDAYDEAVRGHYEYLAEVEAERRVGA